MEILYRIVSIVCGIAIVWVWISMIFEKINEPKQRYGMRYGSVGSIGAAFFASLIILATGGSVLFTVYFIASLFDHSLDGEPKILYGLLLAYYDWFFWRIPIKLVKEHFKK